MRTKMILIVVIIMILFANFIIYKKEMLIRNGNRILLKLAPVDPRSLIQGDYMTLRYEITRLIESKKLPKDGYIVLTKDDNDIGHFIKIYDQSSELKPEEFLLRYRKRGYKIKIGAESFFFQEGYAKYFEKAKYGELKISSSGDSVLTGLFDIEFTNIAYKIKNKEIN